MLDNLEVTLTTGRRALRISAKSRELTTIFWKFRIAEMGGKSVTPGYPKDYFSPTQRVACPQRRRRGKMKKIKGRNPDRVEAAISRGQAKLNAQIEARKEMAAFRSQLYLAKP